MSHKLNVDYVIGDMVQITPTIEAVVTAICIRGHQGSYIQYELSYMDSGEYHSKWFESAIVNKIVYEGTVSGS